MSIRSLSQTLLKFISVKERLYFYSWITAKHPLINSAKLLNNDSMVIIGNFQFDIHRNRLKSGELISAALTIKVKNQAGDTLEVYGLRDDRSGPPYESVWKYKGPWNNDLKKLTKDLKKDLKDLEKEISVYLITQEIERERTAKLYEKKKVEDFTSNY